MTLIKIYVQDTSARGAVVKAIRQVIPFFGVGEILRRMSAAEAICEMQLYTANHDETVATLRKLVTALQDCGATSRITKLLRDVRLTQGSRSQNIESDLTVEMLYQMFAQFEDIRHEQQTIAELEDETD